MLRFRFLSITVILRLVPIFFSSIPCVEPLSNNYCANLDDVNKIVKVSGHVARYLLNVSEREKFEIVLSDPLDIFSLKGNYFPVFEDISRELVYLNVH